MRVTIKALTLLTIWISSAPCFAESDPCSTEKKNCSDVDIDHPRAEEAYQLGCSKKDYYSCARLGQYYEFKKKDIQKAVPFYQSACDGKDEFGCTQSYAAHMKLCYVEEKSKFCGKYEPKDEYRIIAFLKKFNPKYADAFASHNFDAPWSEKKAQSLFEKRLQEKNKKLLRILEKEDKGKNHDGADGETLTYYVKCLKGNCPQRHNYSDDVFE